MSSKSLEEVGLALTEGYPAQDIESTRKELTRVVEMVLPALALRASSALNDEKKEVEEVWKFIREGSEQLFAPALKEKEIERVKVIYVASKFANNKFIGNLMTSLAIDLARSHKER